MDGGMTLERLQVIIEAQTKGARAEIDKINKKVQDMSNKATREVNKVNSAFKSLFAGIGIAYGITKMAQFAKSSTQMAMKVEGSIQQIKRTMGESSNAFLKWAKDNALAFNMSQSDVANYGAIYSNLVSTFAKDTNQAMTYTTDLLKASSIIASGTGRTMEDVQERIRSGLLGNTEAIEDLGINVNVAMLQSTEAFRKFANGKSWDQLSFQTQQQIRLFGILEQTTNKFGTEVFSNTNSNLQQLVAILKDVALNLGNAFLPILNVVLPILSNFAMGLRTVTGYIATFMQTLFGFTPNANKGVTGATSQVNALGGASDAAGNKAKKAKKEVQNLLGGFDEINTLGKNDDSDDSGSGGVDVGGVPSIGIPSMGEPEVDTSWAEELANKFKGIFEPIKVAFANLMDSLSPFIDNIGTILLWFWDNILVPFGSWTISDLMPAFFNVLAGVFDILNPLLESFMRVGGWLWDNFLQPIAAWTGGVIVDVLNGLADVLKDIGTWMKEHEEVVKGITVAVIAFFLAWEVTKLLAFISTSGGLIACLGAVAASIWACTGAKLVSKAETIMLTALHAKDTIVKWANVAAQGACTIATTAWNIVCGIASTVTMAFGAAMAFLTTPIGLVILAVGAVIAVGVLLYKNWETIMEWAGRMGDVLMDIFGAIGTFIGNVFKGIINGFIGMINFCIGGVEMLIQGFLIPLNGLISGWNATIGLVAGEIDPIEVSIPRVPYLAKGGVVNSATLAMVGEQGKEAVVPLENNTGWINKIADKLTIALLSTGFGNSNQGNQNITVKIGESTMLNKIIGGVNQEQRRQGTTLIEV